MNQDMDRVQPETPAGRRRRRATASRRWLRALVVLLTAAIPATLGWLVWRDLPALALVGGDAYEVLAASRVSGPGDLLRVVTHPWADRGPGYPYYRPVAGLLLAAEYAWRGLEPAGYQRDTLVLFLVGILLVWGVTRRLLGPDAWLASFVAATYVALHPAAVNVLPAVGQRPELFGALSLLLVLLVLPRRPMDFSWRALLAGALAGFACGVHEAGLLALPLVFVQQAVWARGDAGREGLRRALRAVVPTFTIAWLYVVLHVMVVGGWGRLLVDRAHAAVPTLSGDGLTLLRQVFDPLPLVPGAGPSGVSIALAVALGALILMVLLAGAGARAGRWTPAARGALAGLVWVLLSFPLVALRTPLRPEHTLIPVVGAALLLAAIAHGAAGLLARRPAAGRVAGLLLLAGCAAIAGPALTRSACVTRYAEWQEASRLLDNTLAELRLRLKRARLGQRVGIGFVMHYRSPKSSGVRPRRSVEVLDVSGLRGWCRLAFPDKPIRVVFRERRPSWFEDQATILVVAQERILE